MFRTWIKNPLCCWGKVTQNITKAIFFLTRKFIFVLYSIKRKQTQRIMEALPSNPFYPESSSEIEWAVRSCCDFSQIDTEMMVPQPGLAWVRCTAADAQTLKQLLFQCLSLPFSLLPFPHLPPPSLFFFVLSPYFCWQSSFRPFLHLWPPLVNSCPLPSWLMPSLGVLDFASILSFATNFLSDLGQALLGSSFLKLLPLRVGMLSWSWALLEVIREEHLIAKTIAISLYLFQLPAATAHRTLHYFLIFHAVKKKYLSFFLRSWFVLCSEPSLLHRAYNTGDLAHLTCLYLPPCKDKSWFQLHRITIKCVTIDHKAVSSQGWITSAV